MFCFCSHFFTLSIFSRPKYTYIYSNPLSVEISLFEIKHDEFVSGTVEEGEKRGRKGRKEEKGEKNYDYDAMKIKSGLRSEPYGLWKVL